MKMNFKFYAIIVLIAALMLVAQMAAFGFTWSALVSYAAEHGRRQRGGVGLGITIYYGFYFWMLAAFSASVMAACSRRFFVRWGSVFGCLGVWLCWLAPCFSQYPIRLPALAATGAALLLLGSGILMPLFGRYLRTRPSLCVASESEPGLSCQTS